MTVSGRFSVSEHAMSHDLTEAKQKPLITEPELGSPGCFIECTSGDFRANTRRILPNSSKDSTIARRASAARNGYDFPESYLNLSEVIAPPPVQNRDDCVLYHHTTLEEAITAKQDYLRQIKSQEGGTRKKSSRRTLVKCCVILVSLGLAVIRRLLCTCPIWGNRKSLSL
ncbi:hypothetical protein QL093DRAFT_1437771 [Fusarium oxysporum]|nr:hypothetical protein QL093DRAFT_1437771 [Fusarium oxysporum]